MTPDDAEKNAASEKRKMLLIKMPKSLTDEMECLSEYNALECSEFMTLAMENLLEYMENCGMITPYCPALATADFSSAADDEDEPALLAAESEQE